MKGFFEIPDVTSGWLYFATLVLLGLLAYGAFAASSELLNNLFHAPLDVHTVVSIFVFVVSSSLPSIAIIRLLYLHWNKAGEKGRKR